MKSIKKPKKGAKEKVDETFGARLGCCEDAVGALKMKIDFFPENSVNFFEKPTFHFKIKKK